MKFVFDSRRQCRNLFPSCRIAPTSGSLQLPGCSYPWACRPSAPSCRDAHAWRRSRHHPRDPSPHHQRGPRPRGDGQRRPRPRTAARESRCVTTSVPEGQAKISLTRSLMRSESQASTQTRKVFHVSHFEIWCFPPLVVRRDGPNSSAWQLAASQARRRSPRQPSC